MTLAMSRLLLVLSGDGSRTPELWKREVICPYFRQSWLMFWVLSCLVNPLLSYLPAPVVLTLLTRSLVVRCDFQCWPSYFSAPLMCPSATTPRVRLGKRQTCGPGPGHTTWTSPSASSLCLLCSVLAAHKLALPGRSLRGEESADGILCGPRPLVYPALRLPASREPKKNDERQNQVCALKIIWMKRRRGGGHEEEDLQCYI